jgi:post-segregation antitoxin (ccd killing protein)
MRWTAKTIWLPVAAILLGMAACASGPAGAGAPTGAATVATRGPSDGTGPSDSTGPSESKGPSETRRPSTGACPGGWDCAQEQRFSAASGLIATATGHVGVVVRDRVTGAVWQGGEPGYRIWAGSTPKLAFAVALREEARAGQITIDATAEKQIAAMLSVSDNNAAETLWNRYANAAALMQRFRDRYGMTQAGYVTGFPSRWGFIKCTAQDLANLMSYILTTLNPIDRASIVAAMRSVGSVQHWGVWAAGAALRPGVKDGWSIESDDGHDHWITATVGFAGAGERYLVAAMYHQPPGGDSIEKGVHLLTDLVATIFGAPVPAPATIPKDY